MFPSEEPSEQLAGQFRATKVFHANSPTSSKLSSEGLAGIWDDNLTPESAQDFSGISSNKPQLITQARITETIDVIDRLNFTSTPLTITFGINILGLESGAFSARNLR
jgi:hypothetical protein